MLEVIFDGIVSVGWLFRLRTFVFGMFGLVYGCVSYLQLHQVWRFHYMHTSINIKRRNDILDLGNLNVLVYMFDAQMQTFIKWTVMEMRIVNIYTLCSLYGYIMWLKLRDSSVHHSVNSLLCTWYNQSHNYFVSTQLPISF